MGKTFDFQAEDGEHFRVSFTIVEDADAERRFGIRAEIFLQGILKESAEVLRRFFTREEAERMVEQFCRLQVTPCTLEDVME